MIPGHGGWTDRMDCQVVTGLFCYVYYNYVLGMGIGGAWYTVNGLLARVLTMPENLQQQLLNRLAKRLGVQLIRNP